jgi:hypothetical protein
MPGNTGHNCRSAHTRIPANLAPELASNMAIVCEREQMDRPLPRPPRQVLDPILGAGTV